MTATPPDGRISQRWIEAAKTVDDAAGEYVLVAEGVSASVAHRINTGYLSAFRPAGAYHAITRKSEAGPGLVDVWAATTD